MFRSHSDLVRTSNVISTTDKKNEQKSGYHCDICDSAWLTETDVEIHRKKQHMDVLTKTVRLFENRMCMICLRIQQDEDALLAHIKSVHLLTSPNAVRVERNIYICDICNGIFFNKFILAVHLHYIHSRLFNPIANIQCDKCHRVISIKGSWFHMVLHEINIKSTCQICLTPCKDTAELETHLLTHPPFYNCTTCDYTTSKSNYFIHHLGKHRSRFNHVRKKVHRYFTKPLPGPLTKPFRYKLYTGVLGLTLHKLHICVLCREICASTQEMVEHITVDHCLDKEEEKSKPTCCCGEEFFNMILLKQHVFKMKGQHRVLEKGEVPGQSMDVPNETEIEPEIPYEKGEVPGQSTDVPNETETEPEIPYVEEVTDYSHIIRLDDGQVVEVCAVEDK